MNSARLPEYREVIHPVLHVASSPFREYEITLLHNKPMV